MVLKNFDLVIVNSSGGKDSECALFEVVRVAQVQNYPLNKIVVSHQDLQHIEWPGTKELVYKQSEFFGVETYISRRRNSNGVEETLLDYVARRGKWPSNKQRFCTSDFKRGPGSRVVTMLSKQFTGNHNFLHVFGFRKQESPARAKKEVYSFNEKLSTKRRTVFDWLPIHDWSTLDVWSTIKSMGIPYHYAYDYGMPRLSCCFCIFSPFDALVIAGIHNPELLDKYIEVENKIGHTFKKDFSIASVRYAIKSGYVPNKVNDWTM
jgi:3'-phosphoadenosine 5'-phosphosulfate sulfotransferase (PAPS reductase)/FAD synthetase